MVLMVEDKGIQRRVRKNDGHRHEIDNRVLLCTQPTSWKLGSPYRSRNRKSHGSDTDVSTRPPYGYLSRYGFLYGPLKCMSTDGGREEEALDVDEYEWPLPGSRAAVVRGWPLITVS